jgi:hypothetical protein
MVDMAGSQVPVMGFKGKVSEMLVKKEKKGNVWAIE